MKFIRFSNRAILLTVFSLWVFSCDKPSTRQAGGAPPQDPAAAVVLPLDPKAGSIRIEPESGPLEKNNALTITFPAEMAVKELIGKEVPAPVVINPPLAHTFTWSTPRRGIIRVQTWDAEKIARTVTLRPGLTDLNGEPVVASGWGAEFASDGLGLLYVSYLGEGRSPSAPAADAVLDAMQRVELTFSRNVRPAEIARQVSFMDRETHQKFPVRVALDGNQPEVPQGITVIEPVAPLPADREFWLVIERLEESRNGLRLPHLRIYPAGRTWKMEATWARGYNQPKRGKFVRIGFSKEVSGAGLKNTAFKVEPSVPLGKTETNGEEVLLFGDFQTGADYRVTAKAGMKARDGSETEGESSWEVAIPEMRPAVVLEPSHIARRTKAGLAVDFKTCRTGALEWKLARIPGAEFPTVNKRLREFGFFERNDEGDPILDPRDGSVRYHATELLIPALGLPVVASGGVPASPGEEEHPQTIRWPAGTARAGTYLLEISGTDKDGRTCGNRCLVTLSDWWIRHLEMEDGGRIEIRSMEDSSPVAGVQVRIPGKDGGILPASATGADGTAEIPKNVSVVLVGADGAEILHQIDGLTRGDLPFQDDFSVKPPATLITDGDVYEPGETVRFFAVVRERAEDGSLRIPESRDATFSVRTESPGFEPVEIEVKLDATGGASGSWKIPPTAVSGTYNLSLEFGKDRLWQSVTVTDFRLPDFLTEVTAPVIHGDKAVIDIRSTHFHGSANGGAKVRWTAEWLMEDWRAGWEEREEPELPWSYYSFSDKASPDSSKQGMEGVLSAMRETGDAGDLAGLAVPASAAIRGEGVLDAEGRLRITSDCPFPANARGARAQVFWIVEVRDGAGESQREAAEQHVQFAKEILGIDADQRSEDSIRVETKTVTGADEAGSGFSADLELLKREVNVSKEQVGEHLIRYRNVPVFTSVWKKRVTVPGVYEVPPGGAGDYVIVAKPADMPGAVPVSKEITGFRGSGDSVVLDDFTAEIIPDKPTYQVGGTASLQIRAPFAGWANVSVETDHVIRSLPPIKLKGNSDRISLPILAEYFPNVFVSVHLTGDSGGQGRPSERLAQCELKVVDPLKILTVTPVPGKNAPFLPGSRISGSIKVAAGDKPLAGASVMVMAVDEALLSLGDWSAPDPAAVFYPDRRHGVASGRALGEEWYEVRHGMLSHSQKGFIIGGGGSYDGGPSTLVRENFDSRPLWQTTLKTGADGTAPFSFTAPDSLTSYRIVAFAHNAAGAFGTGSGKVSVSKDLRIKPFLPAFLREGDLVQLRCNLEYDGKAPLTVSCSMEATGPVTIEGGTPTTVSLSGGQAGVATSSARVQPGSAGKEAVFLLKAAGPEGRSDAIRIRVPILPAHILQTEIQSGDLAGGDSWNVSAALDRVPPSGEFSCDVMLSGTSWLPKLANLPDGRNQSATLADVASTALCTLLRPQLAGYLPQENNAPPASTLREFQRSMDAINASLIQEAGFGWLPRWPQASEPDDATTALVAFSLDLVKQSRADQSEGGGEGEGGGVGQVPVPDDLALALKQWRWSVLDPDIRPHHGQSSAFTQCMALLMESHDDSSMVEEVRVKALLHSLYNHRETLDLEAKCLLALANHSFQSRVDDDDSPPIGLSPAETKQLVDEVEHEDAPTAFNPETLGTRTRAEAIRLHALVQVGRAGSDAAHEELRRLMKPIRESSQDLSAQENLWILLAAKSAIELDSPAKLATLATELGSTNSSENGVSIGWLGHPAVALRKYFPQPVRTPYNATWMIRATHRSPVPAAYGSASLRLSRTLTNLTSPDRNGGEASPFQLGDYVLISYLVEGDQTLHQLQIEEQLPAAMELVNPDLPSVRATFSIPTGTSGNQAELSYADRRGSSVSLYFDKLPAGKNQYSVLVRTAGAGVFSWPAAQAAPVYDKRFRATAADGTVHSKAGP